MELFTLIFFQLVNRCVTGTYSKPYSEHKNLKHDFQILIQTAKHGLRPVIHSGCPPPFSELMQSCWNEDPTKRPDIFQVIGTLQGIQNLFHQEQQRK